MSVDWNDLLISFLHDPPDKALHIRGHEDRTARYATAALGREVTKEELHGGTRREDIQASIAERLPMPTAGTQGERAVGPENSELTTFHTLSGQESRLKTVHLQEDIINSAIEEIVGGRDDPFHRFLAIWRILPEKLAEFHPFFTRLPADTRVPDHTIWHHMDITAGLAAALLGAQGAAFLSFSIGPVQPFIEAARTVRDLWSGSAILSWLTFQAMLPVIKELGPTAVVYPYLRGLPLMDLWLRGEGGLSQKLEEPDKEGRKAPCVPNRFLAVVPWSDAKELAERCKGSAENKWLELGREVRGEITKRLPAHGAGWDARWDDQIKSFFEIRTSVLPWGKRKEDDDEVLARLSGKSTFEEAYPDVAKVRGLARAMPVGERPGYPQDAAGRWQAEVDLSARLMEARRTVRHVPHYSASPGKDGNFPPKCSLLGSYEQMGPDGLEDSRKFWEAAVDAVNIEGVRLRKRDRLCAVSLVKRFAPTAFFTKELRLKASDLRYFDTATVAAEEWLHKAREKDYVLDPAEIDGWSGQWLHWPSQDSDEDEGPCPEEVFKEIKKARSTENRGPAPAYYAILMMDADGMGSWLRGENSPNVREILHRKTRDYYESLPDNKETVQAGLDAKRPVGPALHAAISEALTNFAVHIVPRVVDKYKGTLIYAGGDDVLALLPARSALACARDLQRAFQGDPAGDPAVNGGADKGFYRKNSRDLLVMGPKATLSAGIAVVHYKEDLREALRTAREAEKAAKAAGKDALQLTICRRSGEHSSTLCPWDWTERVEGWIEAFEQCASDRWAYRLRAELPTLRGRIIPMEAVQAEIKRQVDRSEEDTRKKLMGNGDLEKAGETFVQYFAEYCDWRMERALKNQLPDDGPLDPNELRGRYLEDFLTLVQSASFLARERDGA